MFAEPPTASGNTPVVLRLTLELSGRIPAIAVTRSETRGGTINEQHLRISAGAPQPNLSSLSGGVDEIVALDVLEHTRDEERWLLALAEIANPGARLRLRVPLQSPLAWLDGLNAYRYVQDISNRGRAPRETRPTGWHRYYAEADIVAMVEHASFRVERVDRNGVNLTEPPRLATLVVGDWLLHRPGAERRSRAAANRLAALDRRIAAGPLSTRIQISAVRM